MGTGGRVLINRDWRATVSQCRLWNASQTQVRRSANSEMCQKTTWAELFELTSAVASSVDRTSMPSAFAVLRWMMSLRRCASALPATLALGAGFALVGSDRDSAT